MKEIVGTLVYNKKIQIIFKYIKFIYGCDLLNIHAVCMQKIKRI